ncbi:putative zinc finger protein [Lachnotalea glycerini]|uniref:Putative zinc finger protein n=2 Tax=Lachnotalea glycerini TaxID=1763509 RepID=A0A318EXI3_9FIRM|nr:putative zinc finger protein [Lachnotalea glycerini]
MMIGCSDTIMECKEAQKLVTKYIADDITEQELEQFMEHIQICKDCYDELEINYTIFSAFVQLDNNEDSSDDINAMLLEKLKASRKYIRRKKIFNHYRILIYIAAMIVLAIIILVQLGLWL